MYSLNILNIILMFIIVMILVVFFLQYRKSMKEGYDEEYIDIMELFEEEPQPPKCKVAIALLMRKPIDLPIWFKHHRKIGISHFFIRLEDSPGWEDYLASQKDVTYEVSSSDKSGNNYETLMYRQLSFVNGSLKKAKQMGIDWIFHIDADELIHGSLKYLDDIHKKYKCVRLENAEAVFSENEETCFSAVKFLRCSKNAPCRSYVNGKGGGRVEDGVKLMGPHHFGYNDQIQGENVYEMPFKQLRVLHFDSCSFGAWAEKFKHLSDKKQNNIPFPYYSESIDAAVQAYDIYKKHNMKSLEKISSDLIYTLNE